MRKFTFRLEKLLRVREHSEDQAKDQFRMCRQAVLAVEKEIEDLDNLVEKAMIRPCLSLPERIQTELLIMTLKEDRTMKLAALSIVEQEADTALGHWRLAKQDAEIVRKLKENAYIEWKTEAARKEQAQLDEWAVIGGRAK